MNRIARATYWITPSLFCLILYRLGLITWFRQDDFAWLSLDLRLRETGDLWNILFAPMAQGTIRPLSERLFFLVFYNLFGLEAMPFRMAVFLTQFAGLALLMAVVRRLTGSRLTAFWAPVFWVSNSALVQAMCWSSAYNQVLCAFFLLAAFYFLLRHIETGKRSFLIAQWVAFLAGFGALELNVVYPALAAAYAWCCARPHFKKTLWMFPVSAAYAAFHHYASSRPRSGTYAMHFDTSVFPTLWTYWQWALGPARLEWAGFEVPAWITPAGTAALSVALLGFAAWQVARRRWLAAFLLLWFLIVIAPVLPLRSHISDYYLTVPVIGLAILGAWAFSRGLASGWPVKIASVLAASVYLAASIPVVRASMEAYYETGLAAKSLVEGVTRARELHPDKLILLADVSSALFWSSIFHRPFRLTGVSDVYLEPGLEATIDPHPELGAVADYVLPAGPALRALQEDRAVVYTAREKRLRNVTSVWRALGPARWSSTQDPKRLDAGNPLFEGQLGPSWYAREGAYRWMPKRATVRLGGPSAPGEKLYVSGYCPRRQLEKGPLGLAVSVDGHAMPPVKVTRGDELFEFAFPLPPALLGKPGVEVTLEVDRTIEESPGGRPLGLVFGTLAIR